MKKKIIVEGCPYEDRDDFDIFNGALNLYANISMTINAIRNRLDHCEISEDEKKFLTSLIEELDHPIFH